MLNELKKRKLLRKAYYDLIQREGRPDPNEIREKIYEIGPHRIMSIIFIERKTGHLMIHSGNFHPREIQDLCDLVAGHGQGLIEYIGSYLHLFTVIDQVQTV